VLSFGEAGDFINALRTDGLPGFRRVSTPARPGAGPIRVVHKPKGLSLQLGKSRAACEKRDFISCGCEASGVKAAKHTRSDDENTHPNIQSFHAARAKPLRRRNSRAPTTGGPVFPVRARRVHTYVYVPWRSPLSVPLRHCLGCHPPWRLT